ncbi:hypothetical protein AK830_g6344 [Neonectria ditissima]|uniref:Uncharacterized protein n=1 Tax=Neonectria ditissima TaxID=78410 RepID=A0A0N8H6Y2_9HYPO|nr:hypothetical protein AK830_g6344 [Neonectria ditissima]
MASEQEDKPPTGPVLNSTPEIIGAVEMTLTPEEMARQRDEFAAVKLGKGAKRMTAAAAAKMPPSSAPATRYLPSSETWAPYVPDGLISASQWPKILDEVQRHVSPVVEAKVSRAERLAERSRRKGD